MRIVAPSRSYRTAICGLLGLALFGCEHNPYVIGAFVDDACRAHTGVIACSGFERPDLSEWSRTEVVSTGAVEQTDSRFRSGRGALHATTTDRDSEGVVALEFPPVTSGELFLRVYMYVPGNVETKTSNVLFLGDEPSPDPFKGIDFNLESDAPQIFAPQNDPARYSSTTVTVPRDRWFCFQTTLGISQDAGVVSIAVDGVDALEVTGLRTLTAGGVHLLRAGVDWSSKQTTPFEIFMDDLVLSTAPVACDG